MLAFAAGGGTPLYMAAVNEYREPKYSRNWIDMWNDETKRLEVAKLFQLKRIALIERASTDSLNANPEASLKEFADNCLAAKNTTELLVAEGHLTKRLYALLSKEFGVQLSRKPQSKEFANEFLDAGNYLAYGLAACCLWVLGIPYSYPLMHGKTRRGALVFDVADLVKDALIMPIAFSSAAKGESSSDCRRKMLANIEDYKALKLMFNEVLAIANT